MLESALFVMLLLCQDAKATPPKESSAEVDLSRTLLSAKRIFVESFGEDAISKTLHAMVIDAFSSSKGFIVTENRDKADLFLKGSALEKTNQEAHSLGATTTVASAGGGAASHIHGASGSSHGGFIARSLGISDAQASIESINDARASVRLVTKQGDVV